MALSFASQLPAQTPESQKTPQNNRSGNNNAKDILNRILEEVNRRRTQRNTDPGKNGRPNTNDPGPNRPQNNSNGQTNTNPANQQGNNNGRPGNNSGPNNPAGNNSNNSPNTNANIRTPVNNSNSGNTLGNNTNLTGTPQNTTANADTNTNTNLEPGAVLARDTPLRQQSPPQQPSSTPWPFIFILIIVALAAIGIVTFIGVRYALTAMGSPASGSSPPEAAAAAPAVPQIDIGLRPDIDPKLEIAGGDVPSLDTGISLKFKFDPGKPYLS